MTPWHPGKRSESWASNGKLAWYTFISTFAAYVGFSIWHQYGGPSPSGLEPMVMAALGGVVTVKSVERNKDEKSTKDRVESLETYAKEAHPDVADRVLDSKEKGKPKEVRDE